MLKVILFALFAIGLSSCDLSVKDTSELYTSLLPTGKPLFEIKNTDVQQKLRVQKEGQDALVFQVVRLSDDAETTFKYNQKTYLLHGFKIIFEGKKANVEILFVQQKTDKETPTNIKIMTALTDGATQGITADPISVSSIKFLIGDKDDTSKSVTHSVEWIPSLIKNKKPMFLDIQRRPATLVFVSPPVKTSNEVLTLLAKLKNKMKSTLAEKVMNMFGGSKRGSGRGMLSAATEEISE